MSNLLLSIVTINYNNSNGLRKTIDSIRKQAFNNYEHIIIDGGSTDESVGVIEEMLRDDSYASHLSFWCSEKDGGIYNAMNKGIVHSKGDYVAILNSGDCYVANALDVFDGFAKSNQNVVLYGAVSSYCNGLFEGAFCASARYLFRSMIPHPASFVPLKFYEKYGLYDESFRSSGDWEFFLRLYKAGVQFVYLDRIIADFDLGGISSTNKKIVEKENRRLLLRWGEYKLSYKQRLLSLMKCIYKYLLKAIKIILSD